MTPTAVKKLRYNPPTRMQSGLCPTCREMEFVPAEIFHATECYHCSPDRPLEGRMWLYCPHCSQGLNCCRGCGVACESKRAPDLCRQCLDRPRVMAVTASACGHLSADQPLLPTLTSRRFCVACGLIKKCCRGCGANAADFITNPSDHRRMPWGRRIEKRWQEKKKQQRDHIVKYVKPA